MEVKWGDKEDCKDFHAVVLHKGWQAELYTVIFIYKESLVKIGCSKKFLEHSVSCFLFFERVQL